MSTCAASGTDPVGNTIGGEGIIIPVQVTLLGTAADDVATPFPAHSAISNVALFDLTSVDTKVTTPVTFFSGRLGWQIEGFSALSVNLQDMGVDFPEMFTDAAQTDPQRLGDCRGLVTAIKASAHSVSEKVES